MQQHENGTDLTLTPGEASLAKTAHEIAAEYWSAAGSKADKRAGYWKICQQERQKHLDQIKKLEKFI